MTTTERPTIDRARIGAAAELLGFKLDPEAAPDSTAYNYGRTADARDKIGRRLHFSIRQYGPEIGRLSIHGCLPERENRENLNLDVRTYEERQRGETLTIHMSGTRPAAAIAGEIRRRLLPRWLVWLDRAVVQIASEAAYREGVESMAAKLAAAGGGRVRGDAERCVDIGGATLSPMAGDDPSVRFEHFTVPFATALKIASLLSKKDKEQEPE